MKICKLLATVGLLTVLVNPCRAASLDLGHGFATLDPMHPQVIGGCFTNFTATGSEGGALLALVTQSSASLLGESWTPLSAGWVSGSKQYLSFGPSANVSEPVKAAALAFLNAVTQPGSYPSLKGILAPNAPGVSDITLSLGPQLLFEPFDKWRSDVRAFVGAAWKF